MEATIIIMSSVEMHILARLVSSEDSGEEPVVASFLVFGGQLQSSTSLCL